MEAKFSKNRRYTGRNQKRLQVNQKETMPVVENFRERGLLIEIDGTPSIEKVFERYIREIE